LAFNQMLLIIQDIKSGNHNFKELSARYGVPESYILQLSSSIN